MKRLARHAIGFAAVTAVLASVPALACAADSSEGVVALVGVLFYTAFMMFFAVVYGCMYMIIPLLMVLTYTLVVIVLIDLVKRHDDELPAALEGRPDANERLMWVLIILLGGLLGAIIYHVLVMRRYPLSRLRPAAVPPAPPGE